MYTKNCVEGVLKISPHPRVPNSRALRLELKRNELSWAELGMDYRKTNATEPDRAELHDVSGQNTNWLTADLEEAELN